jgi:hypothetical protein
MILPEQVEDVHDRDLPRSAPATPRSGRVDHPRDGVTISEPPTCLRRRPPVRRDGDSRKRAPDVGDGLFTLVFWHCPRRSHGWSWRAVLPPVDERGLARSATPAVQQLYPTLPHPATWGVRGVPIAVPAGRRSLPLSSAGFGGLCHSTPPARGEGRCWRRRLGRETVEQFLYDGDRVWRGSQPISARARRVSIRGE